VLHNINAKKWELTIRIRSTIKSVGGRQKDLLFR